MIRTILAAVVGLLLGMGGGIAAAWLRRPPVAPPAVAVADSASVVDSLAVADSAGGEPSDSASVECRCADDATEDTVMVRDSGMIAANASSPPAPKATATADPITAMTDSIRAHRERLVRIMGAMKPADAARALIPLDDAQVEAVLFGMSERKAAAILSSFPAERASTLMRSILNRRQS